MGIALSPAVQAQVAVFLLAFVRVSGIFLTAPFYSGMAAPVQVKIGLVFFLTACMAPFIPVEASEALAMFSSPLGLALAAASELAIGFAIGMAGAAVLGAIQTAGYLVAQDIGITIANVIDPITSIQTSVIGQLQVAMAIFIFLCLDFHHGILRLVAGSFRLIPLGGLWDHIVSGGAAKLGEFAIAQGSHMWDAAVRIALPTSLVLFLVTIAMGFLARAVPEMNVFIIGFGLRVLVGMWVLVLTVPLMAAAFTALFERAARESASALRALAGS